MASSTSRCSAAGTVSVHPAGRVAAGRQQLQQVLAAVQVQAAVRKTGHGPETTPGGPAPAEPRNPAADHIQQLGHVGVVAAQVDAELGRVDLL